MKYIPIFLILLIGIIGCQSNEKSTTEDPIQLVEEGLIPAVVFEGQELPKMNLYERMEHYKVPGVSMVFFRNDSIEWAKGYGSYSFQSSRRIDPYTLFQAASISKPVAAAGILRLAQTNQIDIDQPVNNYLSKDWKIPYNALQKDSAVTLRKLLSHQAGVNVHGFPGYAQGEKLPTTTQILKGVSPANTPTIEVTEVPGSVYRYSGGGYTIAQKVMEEMIDGSLPDYLKNNILLPFGMRNSFFLQPLPDAYKGAAAIGHRSDGTLVVGQWHNYPELAAAGLWTTPSDLANFALELQRIYDGKTINVLNRKSVETMLTGVGPAVYRDQGRLAFGHGGANEGYRNTWWAFADGDRAGFAIMTNSDSGMGLINEIKRSISEAYGWDYFHPETLVLVNLSEEQIRGYQGRYYNEDLQMQIEVIAQPTKLIIYEIGKEAAKESYFPIGSNSFVNADTNDRITFQLEEDNTLSGFDYNNRYTFTLIKQ